MNENQQKSGAALNRAKPYQLALFPMNNGATNVYYVLILTYIATFGNTVLGIATVFASFMVTGMRVFDAITDPIIGALMDKTNGRFGKFRPFMVIGSVIMAVSVICLYILTPFVPASMMGLRYALFILLYAVWVIGYTFQTSVTRAAQAVLTNDPKQRPLFTIFNTIGSLAGMGVMQFIGPILARDNIFGDYNRSWFAAITPIGICISVLLTILAIIGIWEKDQPKYFGLGGGKQEKVKVSEYIDIIKANKPLQRLMVAGGACKLALSIATNITVLIMLYGRLRRTLHAYDGGRLHICDPLLRPYRQDLPEKGTESVAHALCGSRFCVLYRRAGAPASVESEHFDAYADHAGREVRYQLLYCCIHSVFWHRVRRVLRDGGHADPHGGGLRGL